MQRSSAGENTAARSLARQRELGTNYLFASADALTEKWVPIQLADMGQQPRGTAPSPYS